MEAHDRHVRRKLKEIRENSKDSRESIRKAISNLEQMERNITAQAEKTSAFFADLRVRRVLSLIFLNIVNNANIQSFYNCVFSQTIFMLAVIIYQCTNMYCMLNTILETGR